MVRITRRLAVTAVASLLLVMPAVAVAEGPWDSLLAPASACPGQSDASAPGGAQELTMLCMHNYARAASGLAPLISSKQLRVSSARKAKDMKACNNFSHEACGRNAFYWLRKVGFLHGTYGVGENLAFGSGALGSVRTIMSNWLNSDEHRTNLLMPAFREIGIGMAEGRFLGHGGTQIWVAHVGYHR
jgi:uncharacterized protein YkwD